MSAEPRLFIGGPADGEWKAALHGREVRLVPPLDDKAWVGAVPDNPKASVRVERYLLRNLGGGWAQVFVHDSISDGEELYALLVKNYRPEKPDGV